MAQSQGELGKDDARSAGKILDDGYMIEHPTVPGFGHSIPHCQRQRPLIELATSPGMALPQV